MVGIALAGLSLHDLFHTLFHPAARGKVSDSFALLIWKACHRFGSDTLTLAGPLAFIFIVFYWAASVCVGFALIYLPHLRTDFVFMQGLNADKYQSFWGALTISLGSLITLSTGVYASKIWLEFLMSIESVFGFGLLTASISWILSIYPVLEHRRSLAHEATLLHFSEEKGLRDLRQVSDPEIQELLLGLASQLSTHRNELTQFPITYYFYEQDKETALAGILPYLADVATQNAGRKGGAAIAAVILGGAIDDYLEVIARYFLGCRFTSREEILRAYAKDHKRQIVRSPRPVPRAA